MTASYERDTERGVNLIFATLTIAAGIIWCSADLAENRRADTEITSPPGSSGASGPALSAGAACAPPGPNARTQAAGTAARESLSSTSGTEGTDGKSGS